MFIPLSIIPLYRLTDRLSISYCEKAKDVQSFAFYTALVMRERFFSVSRTAPVFRIDATRGRML